MPLPMKENIQPVVPAERISPTPTTGTGAIDVTYAPGVQFRVCALYVHFSALPVTSEELTMTRDAAAGAAYDTRLLTQNPSGGSGTGDIAFVPSEAFPMIAGDAIKIAYPNTDARTYGLELIVEVV